MQDADTILLQSLNCRIKSLDLHGYNCSGGIPEQTVLTLTLLLVCLEDHRREHNFSGSYTGNTVPFSHNRSPIVRHSTYRAPCVPIMPPMGNRYQEQQSTLELNSRCSVTMKWLCGEMDGVMSAPTYFEG